MTVQLELWQLIGLMLAWFGGVAAFGRLLLRQIVDQIVSQINRIERAHDSRLTRLEERLGHLEVSMARDYVAREDWIHFAGVIDAKLDRLRNLMSKGER